MIPDRKLPEDSAPLSAFLPGPDRKRSRSSYSYRLVYRNARPEAAGCVRSWEVTGGRMPYQIALERDEKGNLRFHCTCADAIFRAEDQGRFCKHVHGLLHIGGEAGTGDAAVSVGA